MGRIRFRVRTLMIVVAFSALLLTMVIQGGLLRRAMMREQVARDLAEANRALAEAAAARALHQARIEVQKMVQLQQLIDEQSHAGGDKGKR